MTTFKIERREMSVAEILRLLNRTDLQPGYQREGTLWSRERRQLFLDSLLNGFDIPPVYLHQLSPPQLTEKGTYTYAVIDGLQRISTLQAFEKDHVPLASDFRFIADGEEEAEGSLETEEDWDELTGSRRSPLAGLSASEMRRDHGSIYRRLMAYQIPVTLVRTDSESLIEELFFRLNEGVPLTPAEKRHRGALLRSRLKPMLEGEEAVLSIARFKNRRRVHEDLLLRLVFVEAKMTTDKVPDLPKRALDSFAASFTAHSATEAPRQREADLDAYVTAVLVRLRAMKGIFKPDDPLLNTSTWFFTYYLLIRSYQVNHQALPERDHLEAFWVEVASLEGMAEASMTPDQLDAKELAGPMPASTTGSYYDRRLELMQRYLNGQLRIQTP